MSFQGKWNPGPAKAAIEEARKKTLYEVGSLMLHEANKTVPYNEGILQASGHVSADDQRAVVSYDTPYAVLVHESPHRRFQHGRRGKWLQLTFQENAARARDMLATLMKQRWPRRA
jgi:hypothetical protein